MHPRAADAAHQPTVILLHSSASSARQWERLVTTLQPWYRVHAIDLHGHGTRAAWRCDTALTLADDAALAASVLAQAGGAHVVGHSYGAAVALKLATMFPHRVHSLTAYEPVLFRVLFDDDASRVQSQQVLAWSETIRERLTHGDEASSAQVFVDFWSGEGAWAALPANQRSAIANRMPTVLQHFDALFGDPMGPAERARLRMPTLFLTGAHTVAATRRIGELLIAAFPFAHHEVLPAMDHMGPITHAPAVNRRIVAFLDAYELLRTSLAPLYTGATAETIR